MNNDMSPLEGTRLTELDVQHKQQFEKFVRAEPNNAFRVFVVRLYDKYWQFNEKYFSGELFIPTYITLANPKGNQVLGCYSSISAWGGSSEIRIRQSIFEREHKAVKYLKDSDGVDRYIFDILLHEMVHQYQYEITYCPEESYHGHGPAFRDQCNRISDLLGIAQRVRGCKKRGKDKHLPSCAQWPHCVRPEGYYGEADEPEPTASRSKSDTEPKLGIEKLLSLCNKNLSVPDKDVLGFKLMSDAFQQKLKGLKKKKGTASDDNHELLTLAQIQSRYEQLMAT